MVNDEPADSDPGAHGRDPPADKPLADIGGKPMIVRAWEQAMASGYRVAVAAGDPEIVDVIAGGGRRGGR